jgi:hypothetical protein
MALPGRQQSMLWFWVEGDAMSDFLRESPPLPLEDQRLVNLYAEIGLPSDTLLYSPEFDVFLNRLRAAGDNRPTQEIARRLLQLRKAARLPRVGHVAYPSIELPETDFDLVQYLLRNHLGTLGSRDQLPYTELFDRIWTEYNRRATRTLDRHQFWRLVARVST